MLKVFEISLHLYLPQRLPPSCWQHLLRSQLANYYVQEQLSSSPLSTSSSAPLMFLFFSFLHPMCLPAALVMLQHLFHDKIIQQIDFPLLRQKKHYLLIDLPLLDTAKHPDFPFLQIVHQIIQVVFHRFDNYDSV